MKTKFIQLIRASVAVAFLCISTITNAATFTAINSGSWSNSTTWSGGLSPGNTISGLDNVIINPDVTVTLDIDVAFNSFLSSLQVNGNLTSSSSAFMLDINNGDLQGNGNLTLHNLRFGNTASMTFTGDADIVNLHNNSFGLTLVGQLHIGDTLFISNGNLNIGSGGFLSFATNAHI